MEHLLRYTANQPLHHQYYYRGYYYMNIRHQPERAAPMFREAAALAPPGQMAPEGITYHSRYLRMLGYTLADMGQLEEAIDSRVVAVYGPSYFMTSLSHEENEC